MTDFKSRSVDSVDVDGFISKTYLQAFGKCSQHWAQCSPNRVGSGSGSKYHLQEVNFMNSEVDQKGTEEIVTALNDSGSGRSIRHINATIKATHMTPMGRTNEP